MIPQLLQRVALRSIHTTATRSAVLAPSLSATRLPAATRSFVTASQPRYARTSSADTTTKAKGTKTKSATSEKSTKTAVKKPRKTPAKKVKAKPARKPKPAKPITVTRRDLPPSPPAGPTAIFVREYFETHPKPPSLAVGKDYLADAIRAYNSLDAAGKQRYSDRCKELRGEHTKAIEEWYRNIDSEKLKAVKKYLKAKGRRLPVNPSVGAYPGNAYARFTAEYYKDHPGVAVVAAAKEAAQAWKSIPEEEKARYRDEAKRLTEEWRAKQAKSTSVA